MRKHRRFFPEFSDMWAYVQAHNVKDWSYTFTFAYGYELVTMEVE